MKKRLCEEDMTVGRKLNLTQIYLRLEETDRMNPMCSGKTHFFHHSKDILFWPNLCYRFTDISIQFTTSDKTVHAVHFITYKYLHVERLAVLVTRPSIEILFHTTIYKWNMIDSLSPDLVSCTQAIYSHGGGKTRVLQKSIDLDSSGPSEVHSCLKSLSPGLKLPERLSTQIENRGFGSRRSLA